MDSFKEFLLAVFNSWVEKVGIILTIIPFIEKIPRVKEWLHDKPLIDRFIPLLWVIGIVCILWGFYSAWDYQRNAAFEARKKLDELTKPKLIGEIDQAGSVGQAVDEHGRLFINMSDTGIFVFATIKNIGAPSVVVNWNLVVHMPGKAPVKAAKRLLPTTMRLDKQSMMYAEDALYNKAVNSPVPTGGQISGVLLFVLEGVTRDECWKQGTILILEFQDVLNTKSEASVTLTGSKDPFRYLPGMRQPLPMVLPPGK
jgi:hypothetical protein